MFRILAAAVLGAALANSAQADSDILLPRLKPKAVVDSLSKQPEPVVTTEPDVLYGRATVNTIKFPPTTRGYSKAAVQRARERCMARLKGLEFEFEALPPLGRSGGCGTAAPLMLKSVAGVRINPPAEANCDFAEALYHWVAWAAKPAARKHLKKTLVTINNASAYACRRRNNKSSGKMSEHAFANALDISTLVFDDGSSTNIKGDWSGLKQKLGASNKASFLRTIRQYACIRFSTVLGPGSDPYHGDHFHVDLAKRKSGFRVCR